MLSKRIRNSSVCKPAASLLSGKSKINLNESANQNPRVLKSYADYYNCIRTHRSLNKDAPVSRLGTARRCHSFTCHPGRTSSPLRSDLGFSVHTPCRKLNLAGKISNRAVLLPYARGVCSQFGWRRSERSGRGARLSLKTRFCVISLACCGGNRRNGCGYAADSSAEQRMCVPKTISELIR